MKWTFRKNVNDRNMKWTFQKNAYYRNMKWTFQDSCEMLRVCAERLGDLSVTTLPKASRSFNPALTFSRAFFGFGTAMAVLRCWRCVCTAWARKNISGTQKKNAVFKSCRKPTTITKIGKTCHQRVCKERSSWQFRNVVRSLQYLPCKCTGGVMTYRCLAITLKTMELAIHFIVTTGQTIRLKLQYGVSVLFECNPQFLAFLSTTINMMLIWNSL